MSLLLQVQSFLNFGFSLVAHSITYFLRYNIQWARAQVVQQDRCASA